MRREGRPGLSAVAWRSASVFELRREGGRDSMKVAQHFVLGKMQKEDVRPVRDDRSVLVLVLSYAASPASATVRSSRSGRVAFFERHPSTSYWATLIESLRDASSGHASKAMVDAHARRDRHRLLLIRAFQTEYDFFLGDSTSGFGKPIASAPTMGQ
jgi:hypothetical protein